MIQIAIVAKGDRKARIDEIYEAMDSDTRVWMITDHRRTANLKAIHRTKNNPKMGTLRRVDSKKKDGLYFECKSNNWDDEAITAGLFAHMVLRYMSCVEKITLEPA